MQYLETLTKRKDALEQTAALAKQNEELRGLLRQYLGADVNDGSIVRQARCCSFFACVVYMVATLCLS